MSYSSPADYNAPIYWGYAIRGPIRPGNKVTPLVDGIEGFNSMYEAIVSCINNRGANNYIYLLAWWLDLKLPLGRKVTPQSAKVVEIPDSSLEKLLPKAATAGIQIRVMAWDYPFRQNTREVDWINNNLTTGAAILDNNTPGVYSSHHQKVLIVKTGTSLIAFCGGMDINIDRVEKTSSQKGSPMHDVHCRIEGPAANDLVHVFVQRWLGNSEHVDIDDKKGRLWAYPADTVAREPAAPPPNTQYVRIVRTFNFIGNGKKCRKEYSVEKSLTNAIKAARDLIYIEDQYFINFYAAGLLKDAVKRIKHLVVLTSDSRLVEPIVQPWTRRRLLIKELMEAPMAEQRVHIFYRQRGEKSVAPDGYIHAKTWIIDDELAVIGSANFDRRAWGFQTEVAALIFDKAASVKDPSFAQRLRMRLWAEHLGVEEKAVRNGLAAINLWLNPGPAAAIRKYVPLEGNDAADPADPRISSIDPVDPEGLKTLCTMDARVIDVARLP